MFIFTVELLDCDPCSPVWKDEVCNRSVPALLRPRGSSGRHQVHLGFQTVGMSYGQSRSHFGCACVVPARVVGAKFFPGRCWFALQCTFDVRFRSVCIYNTRWFLRRFLAVLALRLRTIQIRKYATPEPEQNDRLKTLPRSPVSRRIRRSAP